VDSIYGDRRTLARRFLLGHERVDSKIYQPITYSYAYSLSHSRGHRRRIRPHAAAHHHRTRTTQAMSGARSEATGPVWITGQAFRSLALWRAHFSEGVQGVIGIKKLSRRRCATTMFRCAHHRREFNTRRGCLCRVRQGQKIFFAGLPWRQRKSNPPKTFSSRGPSRSMRRLFLLPTHFFLKTDISRFLHA